MKNYPPYLPPLQMRVTLETDEPGSSLRESVKCLPRGDWSWDYASMKTAADTTWLMTAATTSPSTSETPPTLARNEDDISKVNLWASGLRFLLSTRRIQTCGFGNSSQPLTSTKSRQQRKITTASLVNSLTGLYNACHVTFWTLRSLHHREGFDHQGDRPLLLPQV